MAGFRSILAAALAAVALLTAIPAGSAAALDRDELREQMDRWRHQVEAASKAQKPASAFAEEFDTGGNLKSRFDVPLDEEGLPTGVGGGNREQPWSGPGPGGEVQRPTIRHMPMAPFVWYWNESLSAPIEQSRLIQGVRARGVRMEGGGAEAELWYEPKTKRLLLACFRPEGGEYPVAGVYYTAGPNPAQLVIDRIVMESYDPRGFLADRIRRITFEYIGGPNGNR